MADEKNIVLNCTDSPQPCEYCAAEIPPNSDHACAGQKSLTRAELAAMREERDALAASLSLAERTIGAAMQAASVNNVNAAGSVLSQYQMCGRDYSLILAARDAAQRKAGALWALKKAFDSSAHFQRSLREQIERGEVKP